MPVTPKKNRQPIKQEELTASVAPVEDPTIPKNDGRPGSDVTIPKDLTDKISSLHASRATVVYNDGFDRNLITMSDVPSDNIFYGIEAAGMPMKTHDLFMLEPMEDNAKIADRVIDTIISKYTNLHPSSVLDGDLPYILLWLRENTFPDCPLTYSFRCAKCGKKHSQKRVGIEEAVFNKLPPWYHKGYSLNIDGVRYMVAPATRGKKLEKDRYIANTKKKLDDGDLHILEMAIHMDDPLQNSVAKIENINPKNLPILYDAITSIKRFGFSGKFNVKCEGCGENTTALFRFRKRFYIPEAEGYRLDAPSV